MNVTEEGQPPRSLYGYSPISTWSLVNPVQNVWYTAITFNDSMIAYVMNMQNSGVAKDMGVRLTIDGNIVTGNALAPDSTLAYSYLTTNADTLTLTGTATLAALGLPIYAKSFKMEIRQIDAVVAGQFIYAYVRRFGA